MHSTLDKYRKSSEPLLGEMQNHVESDHYTKNRFGIIHQDDKGNYHNEMVKTEKFKKSEFPSMTKTKDFPKGIKFDEMYHTVNHEYNLAHGKHLPSFVNEEEHEKLVEHPIVQKVLSLVHEPDNHPADLVHGNRGVFKHPITGENIQ